MPARHTLHVALTAELCEMTRQLVESGRYGNASEVVRAALRLLERAETPSLAVARTGAAAASRKPRS